MRIISQPAVLTGDAAVTNVLTGKTFYKDSTEQLTGTMPNNAGDKAAVSAHMATGTVLHVVPAAGYTDGTDDAATIDLATVDADLAAENIKDGVSLLGVTGSYAAPGFSWTSVDEDGYVQDVVYTGFDYVPAEFFAVGFDLITSWKISPLVAIGYASFKDSNVTFGSWTNTVETIDTSAFNSVSSEGVVTFPVVETVGSNAFYDAEGITSLTLGSTGHAVTSIGADAFSGMTALETLTIYVSNPLSPPSGSPWGAAISPTFAQA